MPPESGLFKRYIEPRWAPSAGCNPNSGSRGVAILSSIGASLEGEAEVCHGRALQPCDPPRMVDVQSNQPSENIAEAAPDRDVLAPEEFQELVQHLSVRDRAMVLLIGSTGLRRSEMIALTWSNLNMRTMEVDVLGS
jgi:integrase